MTCLEAQSKIIAYIDYNLEKDEKIDFLRHIQHCPDCMEELNIYYTMIEGMRQLDSNQPLIKDFTKELDSRIERELKHNRQRKDFFRSSVCIVGICIFGFLIFGYVKFLKLLHEEEQMKLKETQGEYYFSQTFEDRLFYPPDEERVLRINVTDEKPTVSFYDKIRQYNMLSITNMN